jgi:hypothetical protein
MTISHNSGLRRVLVVATMALALVASVATNASATHLRGVTITWAPTGVPGEVKFTIQYAQRWTYPSTTGSCFPGSSCPPLGSIFTLSSNVQSPPFAFGDGKFGAPQGPVTSVNQAEDWFIAELTVTHTYAGPGPYTAFFVNTNRISNLVLGHDQPLRMETTVTPFGTNHAPVSSMPAIVAVPLTATTGFVVVGSDADHDTLHYRLSTTQEMFGAAPSACTIAQPPGLSINQLTGQVTWNTALITTAGCAFAAPKGGDLWTAQFMIEDINAQGIVKSKVPVDVILKFVAQVGHPPTLTLSPPGPLSVQVGTPITLTATGNDVDANARLTLNATGIPLGASASSLNQQTTPPVTSTFTWTPAAGQGGAYPITFTATDDTFQQAIASITIFVEDNVAPTITCASPITVPYNMAAPLSVQVADANGDALTVEWKVDGITVQTDNVPASQNTTTVTLSSQTYGAIGNHPVDVTVTDPKSASDSCSTAVNVVRADQTIDFGVLLDRIFGDAPFMISATATSGLPVSFVLQSGPATLVGNTVTITGTGLVTIVAQQSGDSNYSPAADVPQSFQVKQAGSTVTVTCPATAQTYTGSPIAPCTASATGTGLSTIDVTASLVYTANVAVGTAGASASWAGDANHAGSTGTSSFTIGKASSAVIVTCPTTALTYTGSAIAPCTASASGAGLTAVNVSASLVYTTNIAVGTAGASATYAGDTNHTGSSGTGSFTIAKAASAVTVMCPTTALTYTGAAITPCSASATGGGLSAIDVSASLVYTTNINVGAAGASASWPGDANHTNSTGTGSFTIGQAASTVSVTCPPTAQTYTGSAIAPCVASASGAGLSAIDVSASLVYTTNVNVGTAGASASWGGDANHTNSTGASSFTIGKAASTITVTCPTTALTYTGSAIAPCAASATGAGLSAIDVSASLVYTTNINVGTAGASATWGGDGNHTNSTGSGGFTIGRASSTVIVTCPTAQTYTGAAITPCVASYAGVGGLSGSLTPAYSYNVNVGTASVSASYAGDTNHAGSSNTATFLIGQAGSTVTVVCIAGAPHAYTGLAQVPCTAQATGVGMSPVDVSTSLSYANNTNVGLATANASWIGDANHSGNTGAGTFSITLATSTITVICTAGAPHTYTGLAQTPCTASASGAGLSAIDVSASLVYTTNIAAGTANASASWGGDANHTNSTGTGSFTIGKAASTVNVTCPTTAQTYTGSAIAPCAASATGTGLTPIDVSASLIYTTNIAVGSAGASASWAGDANHMNSTGTGGFTIGKAASTVTVSCPTTVQVYIGSAITPCTASYAGTGGLSGALTPTYSSNVYVGTATANATYAGDGNHYSNSSTGNFTIGKRPLSITAASTSKQYSDPLPLPSVNYSGFAPGDSASNLAGTLSLVTTAQPLSPPGMYAIMPSGLSSPNYAISYYGGTLIVTQEDARAFYTGGSLFFASSITASTATVTLSATVKDISAVDPALSQPNPDDFPGNITTAKVAFVDRATGMALPSCANLTPSLVSAGDQTVGTVVCQTTLPVSNSGGTAYEVGIRVGADDTATRIGNYTRDQGDDDTMIMVALPFASNFITGGGYLINTATTAGTYAGDATRKTNFGFNVKYNKGGSNLQGNLNVIDRQGNRVYQFKSNSLTSLGVQYWDTTKNGGAGGWALVPGGACANNYNASPQCPIAATFQGKANLSDVTLPAAISLGGNLTLQVALTDKGEPGSFDTIAITVSNGSSLLLSSMWNGTQTVQKALDGGNLVVH